MKRWDRISLLLQVGVCTFFLLLAALRLAPPYRYHVVSWDVGGYSGSDGFTVVASR